MLAFQNAEFKIFADFKVWAFQNRDFKILTHLLIKAFKNPSIHDFGWF